MAGIFEPTFTPNWADDQVGTTDDDWTKPTDAFIKAGWVHHDDGGPERGFFNWLLSELHNGLNYFMGWGVPLWSSARTYSAGAVVRGAHGSLFVAAATSTNQDPEGPTSGGNEWVPFSNAGLLGNYLDPDSGGHGDITVTSSLDVNGDYSVKNLTVNAGAHFGITNGVLRVQGTLKVVSGGHVEPNASGALDGANGAAGSGGTAGAGSNTSSNGTIFGGSDGGSGSLTGGASDGAPVADSIGGTGGTGGTGTSGTGGAGNPGFAAYAPAASTSILQCARNGGYGFKRGGTASARVPTAFGIQGGGGGGGGGGDGTNKGGGGGAGGGALLIFANHLDLGADGCLRAIGGKGGNAIGTAGPGAGGGGGCVIVLYRTKTGATLTDAVCCAAGAAGTGGAGGATAGAAGRLYMFQV